MYYLSMNKTRTITQGAMFLAIAGALLLIDRQFGFFFQEIILSLLPIIIVYYSVSHTMKDGFVLSTCLLIIGILLGNTTTFVYMPVSIIVGIGCSYVIRKHHNSSLFLFSAILLYVVSEILVTFAVWPLLGIDIKSQMLSNEGLLQDLNLGGNLVSSIFIWSYILMVVLIGYLEGIIVWMLGSYLLKKFKVLELEKVNVLSLKLNGFSNTTCVVLIVLMAIATVVNLPAMLKYGLMTIGLAALIGEGFFGVIYFLVRKLAIERKGINMFIGIVCILFFPVVIPLFSIVGILYNYGPLYKKNILDLNSLNAQKTQ